MQSNAIIYLYTVHSILDIKYSHFSASYNFPKLSSRIQNSIGFRFSSTVYCLCSRCARDQACQIDNILKSTLFHIEHKWIDIKTEDDDA